MNEPKIAVQTDEDLIEIGCPAACANHSENLILELIRLVNTELLKKLIRQIGKVINSRGRRWRGRVCSPQQTFKT